MGIPEKQTAAVLHGPYGEGHTIDYRYPVPQPELGEALVQLEASGICYGDINPRDGYPPATPDPIRPLVAGHEGIGRIVALGEGSTKFKIGDRVGMGWRRSTCHSCKPCKDGTANLCQSAVVNGYKKDGTFQEYMTAPTSDLIPIPKSDAHASELAPLLCAGATALGGVRAADIRKGDWLCIAGAAGGVGSLAVQYAKFLGYKVVAIDSKQKEDHCKTSGADLFVNFEDTDTVVKRITDATGGGVQGTVVCSANPTSYSQALEYSYIGAKIVSIGPSMIHLHTGQLMVKGLKLIAQCNGSQKDIQDVLTLSEKGILPRVEIVSLELLDEALDKLKQGLISGRQAIVFR